MAILPKLLSTEALIRFQDCDPYNHLNNAKYLDYFMNAREDHVLEAYDLDIYGLGKQKGIGWVVVSNQIAYLQPALLMERVEITSRIIEVNAKMMTLEFQMLNKLTGSHKAMMWTRLVHVDIRTGSSVSHSSEFMEMFDQVIMPTDEKTFDHRVAAIRQAMSAAKAARSV